SRLAGFAIVNASLALAADGEQVATATSFGLVRDRRVALDFDGERLERAARARARPPLLEGERSAGRLARIAPGGAAREDALLLAIVGVAIRDRDPGLLRGQRDFETHEAVARRDSFDGERGRARLAVAREDLAVGDAHAPLLRPVL